MNTQTKFSQIINVVLSGVALAMAVAVVVINILGEIDHQSMGMLLGIGLFCLALKSLDKD